MDYQWPGSNPGNLSFGVPNGNWWNLDNTREEETSAVFGEASYDINDKTNITVGFRNYDQDTVVDAKDGYYGVFDGTNKVYRNSDSGTIPKVSVSYDVDDDIMIYGVYSEGFRASGINRVRPAQTAFLSLIHI